MIDPLPVQTLPSTTIPSTSERTAADPSSRHTSVMNSSSLNTTAFPDIRDNLHLFAGRGLPGGTEDLGRALDALSAFGDQLQHLAFLAESPVEGVTSTASLQQEIVEGLDALRPSMQRLQTLSGTSPIIERLNALVEVLNSAKGPDSDAAPAAYDPSSAEILLGDVHAARRSLAVLYTAARTMNNGNGLSLREYSDGKGSKAERYEMRRLLNEVTRGLHQLLRTTS